MKFQVIGTVREKKCDPNTRITHLVFNKEGGGLIAEDISAKKNRDEADQNMYFTHPHGYDKSLVHIYHNVRYGWIARSDHDDELGNNLLHLAPLYHITNGVLYRC